MSISRRIAAAPLLAAALLAAATLTGCSAAEQPSSTDHSLAPDSEGFQEKILEDGTVTDAEYRVAVEAVKACMDGHGWNTSPLTLSSNGFSLNFSVSGTDGLTAEEREAESLEISKDHNACTRDYVLLVERAYVRQHTPTPQEAEAEKVRLIACLEKVGVTGILMSDDSVQAAKKVADQLGLDSIGPGLDCLIMHERAFPDRFNQEQEPGK